MNLLKLNLLLVLCFALMGSRSLQAQVLINLDPGLDVNGNLNTVNDSDNATPLAVGDVIQFGYFTQASEATPFAGTFVPLTSNGVGPATLIGQDPDTTGAGPGQFFYNAIDVSANSDLPKTGTAMSFLIYNSSSGATATFYAAATDFSSYAAWDPQSGPYAQPQNFSLGDDNVVWDGPVGYTSIELPEPATLPLLAGGILLMVLWRRTRAPRAA